MLTFVHSERTINDLRQKLNVARADCALKEQASKSAEMQLTLEGIKHKEVVDSLKAQLDDLQGSEALKESLLDLCTPVGTPTTLTT